MNHVHIHLLITHLAILGSILGGLVLAHGIWVKSDQTKIAAYNVLTISSLGAILRISLAKEHWSNVPHCIS
ncbi:MAG TPA: hypothetical protein PLJ60_13185 [Chryseolinea sp.]|nr:hypothetical protein [Chryseolinea sp.]